MSFLVGQGAIAAVYYASRLIQFPLGIFGHSISNATLPTLSELAAKKEMDKFAETVEFSLTNILFIMIPASLGLIILSNPIIRIIFERGEFDQYSTMITSTALSFYAIGLAAYAVNKFLALCFNALQNTITPVKVSGLALFVNIVLNILFVIVLKTKIAGLAFASSLSAIVSVLVLFNSLHKKIKQLSPQKILMQTLKMLSSGIIMAIVILAIEGKTAQFIHPAIGLLVTIFIATVVYLSASFYFKVYQSRNLFKWIVRKE